MSWPVAVRWRLDPPSDALGHFLGHRATRPHKQHKLDGDPDPGNIAFYKHNKPSKLCSDSS